MHIHVNGEEREIAEGSSVSNLLKELELPADRVAVEINLKIIDRSEFDTYALHGDDRVEILSFIGGGSPLFFQHRQFRRSNGLCAVRFAGILNINS